MGEKIYRIVLFLFVSAACVGMAWVIYDMSSTYLRILSDPGITQGTITKIESYRRSDAYNYKYNVDSIEYNNSEMLIFSGYQTGDNVMIKYNKNNPQISLIKSTEIGMLIKIILFILTLGILIFSTYQCFLFILDKD